MQQVRAPQDGYPRPVVAGDIARASDAVRDTTREQRLVRRGMLTRHTDSEETAWAITAQSVGTFMLARAMRTR